MPDQLVWRRGFALHGRGRAPSAHKPTKARSTGLRCSHASLNFRREVTGRKLPRAHDGTTTSGNGMEKKRRMEEEGRDALRSKRRATGRVGALPFHRNLQQARTAKTVNWIGRYRLPLKNPACDGNSKSRIA